MQFSLKNIILFLFFLLSVLTTVGLYNLYIQMNKANLLINKMQQDYKPVSSTVSDMAEENVMQSGTFKKHMWSELQQKVRNTIVQVFSQITEFNWIEPYKTPNQSESTGSGFFINENGCLITNAHVVDQAKSVLIQIPALGKRKFEVDIIGVSPERDLALLKVKDDELKIIKEQLSTDKLQYLELGDSDSIFRADKIMALGYPLGQQGLKSTTGVVSGREHMSGQHFIQISAPINPGNSGGPSLSSEGKVIGVNSAGIFGGGTQNVGYIIPSNEVSLFLSQINALPNNPNGEPKFLKKPYLGLLFNKGSDALTQYLNNPAPGGAYVVDVYKGSLLAKAGLQEKDMLYEIDGHKIDIYGELDVKWNLEDKIYLMDYVSRLKVGDNVDLVYYRNGKRYETHLKLTQADDAAVRRVYPGYETIDYEVMGGLVVMQLTLNHVALLAQYEKDLINYANYKNHYDSKLIITNIMLNSPAYNTGSIAVGSILSEVNSESVTTLEEYRKAILKSAQTGFLTIKSQNGLFSAIDVKDIIKSEEKLSIMYHYSISQTYTKLQKLYSDLHK